MEGSPPPAVRFASVSKWFRPRRQLVHALSKVDLHVEGGELVSVIGPSGCGKSTLLRLAGGLVAPDRGEIVIGGMTPSAARRAKHYGLVPQKPALLPWKTVGDNVELLRRLNPERSERSNGDGSGLVAELVHEVGLGPFLAAYPRELSGGMQQRVAIVRAFALGAPILLMDEPFSALDEITRSEMRYLLLRLWDRWGSTVLFVTHSIPEAVVLADRVIVLGARPGRVVREIEVPLDRPRTPEVELEPAYYELVAEVRAALREGWSG